MALSLEKDTGLDCNAFNTHSLLKGDAPNVDMFIL